MENKKTRHFHLWIVISLIGLVLFFIPLHWNSFNAPFERDEGEYAYSAWLLKQGILPYQNSFLQKPPMIIYTYGLAQLISPEVWPPRVLGAIFTALTVILLGLIARKEFGKTATWIAMWLALPMLMLPHLTPFAANTEKFMLLPFVAVLGLYIWKRTQANKWHWFFAGICSVLALLYKPIVLFPLLFIFLVWIVETWISNRNVKELLKNLCFGILGGSLTLVAGLGYFLLRDGGYSFWECAVTYNKYYVAQMTPHIPGAFLNFMKIFLENWWILFILMAWFLIKRPFRWWFYLGLLLICLLTVFPVPIGHYYLLLMPVWALITTASIVSIINQIKVKKLQERWQRGLAISIVSIVVLFMIFPIQQQFAMSPNELTLWVYGTVNPFIEASVVAERVANLSSPDDYIFVAGSEPQILYYAQRKSSSRFVIAYPLMMDTPLALDYQKEAVKELKEKPPKVIVLATSYYSWTPQKNTPKLFTDYLDQLLAGETYQLSGGFVWDNNEGHWQEFLSDEQKSKASLLLFKEQTIE